MSTALLSTCPNCVLYEEQLNAKAVQCKVLQGRIEVLESKLQHTKKEKDEVLEHLEDKMIQLSDSAIRIRKLEEQLQSAFHHGAVGELSRAEVADINSRDLEHIRSQLVEKDMKIVELNNTILEKERHILDLQEMFGEQGELVQAKSKAFHIIQKKLLDLNSRTKCEHSTETEAAYFLEFPSASTSSMLHHLPKERRDQRVLNSPGHAVVHLKLCSSNSPPPIDPSEEHSSITQDTGAIQDEDDADDISAPFNYHKKKPRKKVTFDLPRKELSNGIGQEVDSNVTQAIIDLTTENDQLRQTIREMDSCANNVQIRIKEVFFKFFGDYEFGTQYIWRQL